MTQLYPVHDVARCRVCARRERELLRAEVVAVFLDEGATLRYDHRGEMLVIGPWSEWHVDERVDSFVAAHGTVAAAREYLRLYRHALGQG